MLKSTMCTSLIFFMVGEESVILNLAKHMKGRKSGTFQGQNISDIHQITSATLQNHGITQALSEQVHLPSYFDLI